MSGSEHTRTVVVAMDGSEYSEQAFAWYWDNVRRESDRIVLLHVPEYHTAVQSPLEISDLSTLEDLFLEEEKTASDVLEKLKDNLRRRKSSGKVCAIQGRPGDVIVKFAQEEKADLIVTGCRGLGAVKRAVKGSVSDYVLHHAHIPVLICKH